MRHFKEDIASNSKIFLANDMHVGSAAVSEDSIEIFVKDVKKFKHSYVILQGDLLETIVVGDKRFSLDVHRGADARLNEQRERLEELLDPIADKTLFILDGNHERRLSNTYKPLRDVALHFGCEYVDGTMAKTIFPSFRLCSWHGAGFIGSKAGDMKQRIVNEQIALKRKLRSLPADDCEVTACGHYHRLIHCAPDEKNIVVSNSHTMELQQVKKLPSKIDVHSGSYRLAEDERHFICCGSFLKGYVEGISTYSEENGYEPTELGYGLIETRNDKLFNVKCVSLGW